MKIKIFYINFYVVSIRKSEENLEYHKVGQYGPDENQGHLLFVCLVGRIQSRVYVLKRLQLWLYIKLIDNIASAGGIKRGLVA